MVTRTVVSVVVFFINAIVTLAEADHHGLTLNATVSFFFTADPQFGWGSSYGGNEERAMRTMIDLGRLTRLCVDCAQVVPIAGDLTMEGAKRHVYRLAYQGAQSFGVKVLDGLGNHDTLAFEDDEVSFNSVSNLRKGSSLSRKGWTLVDYWATQMSPDNECGHYCRHSSGGLYYTVGITNRLLEPHSVMAYIVQLHNGIHSQSAVDYLRRVARTVDVSKPLILVAHQFSGSALAAFNATVRQLNVALIINGHYHCDQLHDLDHCDFRDNQPTLLLDRFGADFVNVHGAVVPRVTSNAAFHNIFWSVTLDPHQGTVKLKRYDNFHVARTRPPSSGPVGRGQVEPWYLPLGEALDYGGDEAGEDFLDTEESDDSPGELWSSFSFSLAHFQSPRVRPLFPRNSIALRHLRMRPGTFRHLVETQFNFNGFNLPYHDPRALVCSYVVLNHRCVDNYRLRYL